MGPGAEDPCRRGRARLYLQRRVRLLDESRKGVLSKGRLADFVMLERNIFEIPPEEIDAVRVRMTVVGGKQVFDASR